MIFSDGYDKSLWLIMKVDKKNRVKVVEFLKSIPSDLFVRFNQMLELYDNARGSDDLKKFHFTGEVYDSNGDIYWFSIDKKTGVLWVGKHVLTYHDIYLADFEMGLVSYPSIDELKCFDKQLLGEISFDYVKNKGEEGDCVEIEYSLIKIPFADLVISHNKGVSCGKTRVRKIDTKCFESNYDISSFDRSNY